MYVRGRAAKYNLTLFSIANRIASYQCFVNLNQVCCIIILISLYNLISIRVALCALTIGPWPLVAEDFMHV